MSYTVNVGPSVSHFQSLITSPDRFPGFPPQQQNSNCMISSRMSPIAFNVYCSFNFCQFLRKVSCSLNCFFSVFLWSIIPRISKIDFDETGSSKSTVIHFEKPSAAKTALMVRLSLALRYSSSYSGLTQLNGSLLEGSNLIVHSDTVHPDEEDSEATHVPGAPLDQSDKPRAGSKYPPVSFISWKTNSWLSSRCGISGQGL